jgi:integrase
MIYRRGSTLWVKFYRDGVPIRESAGKGADEQAAKDLLRLREGDVVRGVPVGPKVGRIRVDEALGNVVTDYRVNRKRSLTDLEGRINNHLLPYFRGWKMTAISTASVRAYTHQRQAEGAANASINRELAALKRAFVLAVREGSLVSRPYIPLLSEDNIRQGFFERDQFEAVRRHMPEAAQRLVTFEYITGWRNYSEVYALQWPMIDFAADEVRLPPGLAKNREPRVFPMTAELRQVLIAQRAYVDAI